MDTVTLDLLPPPSHAVWLSPPTVIVAWHPAHPHPFVATAQQLGEDKVGLWPSLCAAHLEAGGEAQLLHLDGDLSREGVLRLLARLLRGSEPEAAHGERLCTSRLEVLLAHLASQREPTPCTPG